jgi:hypothetical protein
VQRDFRLGTADATTLPRQELELGFVFLGGENEVGGELVPAFGDEILDQVRAAFGPKLFRVVAFCEEILAACVSRSQPWNFLADLTLVR